MPTDRTARRAAALIASVLSCDGLLHLCWSTGSTWPARDVTSLSYAVLGADVPFTPPVLLPLATVLFSASGVVVARARLDRPHALLRLGTWAVAAGLSLRGLAGIYWLFTKDPGTAFYWLNLGAYTPLCAVLATAAIRVARPVLVEHREDAVRVR
ncbi:DUF3995 domain-containing protein [Streptomyces sp. NPDC056242]|uniref:DUF3995 domain-containing protein n=1 Tax=Streptomyces sp. NPDC056242 TaxID=3345760 RepID=UPI0035E2FE82